jgi:hypothetical protein
MDGEPREGSLPGRCDAGATRVGIFLVAGKEERFSLVGNNLVAGLGKPNEAHSPKPERGVWNAESSHTLITSAATFEHESQRVS